MRRFFGTAGGLAAAGVVAVAGSVVGPAFTASGFTADPVRGRFVGGTVTQSVSGATLAGVRYEFGDPPADTTIRSVRLVFSEGADGRPVAIAFTGATTATATFTCTDVDPAGHASTCSTTGVGQSGATGAVITVGAR